MSVKKLIETKLRAHFGVTSIKITNESHLHAGHSGDNGSGNSHFHIYIRADELASIGRVARHRAIYAALGELTKTIHALSIDAA